MPDEQDRTEREVDAHSALEAMASTDGAANIEALGEAGTSEAVMDSRDALEAMAAGEFENPSQPASAGDSGDAEGGLSGDAPATDVGPEGYDIADADEPPRGNPRQRQAARVARQNQTTRVHAAQFKKTMIPLLLSVGGLLLVFSGVTVFTLLVGGGSQDGPAQVTMLSKYGPVVVMVSCPLAAMLMAGAWWFHRETDGSQDK